METSTFIKKKTCCLHQENLKPDDFDRYFYQDIYEIDILSSYNMYIPNGSF